MTAPKDNAAPVGAGRGAEPTYESIFSVADKSVKGGSANPKFRLRGRCECCGQRLPERPLGMSRDEMARADALGMGPATHSMLSGALLDEEVEHLLERLRIAAEPVPRPGARGSLRPRSPAAQWRAA